MARYRDAIDWMAYNDDTEWTAYPPEDANGALSVTAALVADLFGKDDKTIRADLIRALKRRARDLGRNRAC